MVDTVAGDGAPRSLSDFRSSGVCWTRPFSFSDSSLVGLRPFWLLFHPALPLFFSPLALRYWLTLLLHSPLFHINYLLGHNWHYSPLVGLLANSLLYVPKIATSIHPFPPHHYATPVDRSLVMRALGGAITSPCSNDSESRRPTIAIFGLCPICCFIVGLLFNFAIH